MASSDRGVLDLTEVAPVRQRVRLPLPPWPKGLRWLRRVLRRPTSQLYALADPNEFGVASVQTFMSLRERVSQLQSIDDPSDDDLAEMMSLLDELCQTLVPDAPAEIIDKLGLMRKAALVEGFQRAFAPVLQAAARRAEASEGRSTSAT